MRQKPFGRTAYRLNAGFRGRSRTSALALVMAFWVLIGVSTGCGGDRLPGANLDWLGAMLKSTPHSPQATATPAGVINEESKAGREVTPMPTLAASLPRLPRRVGGDGSYWSVIFTPGATSETNRTDGQAIIDRLIGYFDAAQSSIHLAAFETDLNSVAEALIRAHERGVDVRWITDDENGIDADIEEGRGQFELMEDAGISIRDDQRSAFMHNKFIIIDERVLWTGSMNLTSNDVFRNNNNIVIVESPALATIYEREFREMWDGQYGPRSPSTVDEQQAYVGSGSPVLVRFAPEDEPFESLVQLALLAEKSIRFMAFSYTHDDLGAAMRARAAAGVDVQGIFEVRGSETEYSEMPPLYCAGIPVRQDGNPGTFHHKVVIIDDSIVVTGSMNFSNNAAESNDENVLAISDPAIAQLYLEEFDRRWAEATDPDPADMACD